MSKPKSEFKINLSSWVYYFLNLKLSSSISLICIIFAFYLFIYLENGSNIFVSKKS